MNCGGYERKDVSDVDNWDSRDYKKFLVMLRHFLARLMVPERYPYWWDSHLNEYLRTRIKQKHPEIQC